jgi:peptidoglycan-associated lipoprotein
MKYISHFALPLLMVGLLIAATVLPKFVQKGEAAATTTTARPPEYSKPQASDILPAYVPTQDSTSKANFLAPAAGTVKVVQPIAGTVQPNFDEMLAPVLAKLTNGDWDGAEGLLESLDAKIPTSIKAGFRYSIDSAREVEKSLVIARAEGAKAAHSAKELKNLSKTNAENQAALAAVKSENDQLEAALKLKNEINAASINPVATPQDDTMPRLNSESVAKIQSSIIELNKATQAARLAAQQAEKSALETAKLRAAYEARQPITPVTPNTITTAVKPQVSQLIGNLPATKSVSFGFNSSVIPSSAEKTIESVAEILKKQSNIGVQLRGYSDSIGHPEYNALLSRARSLKVEESLVGLGISKNQIDVLPFGSSVSPQGRAADFRRVDLVFFER